MQASETVKNLLEIIKSTLESGDSALSPGFSKFCVKQKAEQRGKNPTTEEEMILEPGRF